MKILVTLDNGKLTVLNNAMQIVDTLTLQNQPRHLKSSISICIELYDELLQKAMKNRKKDKSFIIKLPYYKADALWNYLNEFEIYFPDTFGIYEKNALNTIKAELHQQLI